MFPRQARAWVLVITMMTVLSLLLVACGDEEDEPTQETGSSPETTLSETGTSDDTANESGESQWDQTITFGDGGFDSIQFHNRVAMYVMEHGYGYETEAIPAEAVTRILGLRQGDIQVSMEIWADQNPTWFEGIEEGSVVDLGSNYGQSIQGWFVPTYMIEGDEERGIEPMTPDLKSVEDLPQYWEVFAAAENPDAGRFYNCIPGWDCSEINIAKLEAYGLLDYYEPFNPGSGPALATSLVSAYEQGKPWFGYYWAPTWIFAQLDLTQIEEPDYTDECWDEIFSGEVGCAYPSVNVRVGANAEFAEQAPELAEFLSNYNSTMDETSEVLLYIRDNDLEPLDAAIWWLENNQDTWTEWVPEDVADKVIEALENGETIDG